MSIWILRCRPVASKNMGLSVGLYGLYGKLTLPVFIKTVKWALKYCITDIRSVERIAVLQMRDGDSL